RDGRRLWDAAHGPEAIEAAGNAERRFRADVTLEYLAVIADQPDDSGRPVIGDPDLLGLLASSFPTRPAFIPAQARCASRSARWRSGCALRLQATLAENSLARAPQCGLPLLETGIQQFSTAFHDTAGDQDRVHIDDAALHHRRGDRIMHREEIEIAAAQQNDVRLLAGRKRADAVVETEHFRAVDRGPFERLAAGD